MKNRKRTGGRQSTPAKGRRTRVVGRKATAASALSLTAVGKNGRPVSAGAFRAPRHAVLSTSTGDVDVVVMPRDRFERLNEDLEDAAALGAYRRTRGEETFPMEVAMRIAGGESPVRVFRQHRGLTQDTLGAAAGISKGYVSEIEHGRKPGSVAVLRRIAAALGVDLDDLL